MKRLILLLPLALLWLLSCQQEEKILVEKEVTFSIANPTQTGNNGGRLAATAEPKSVIVTIKDSNGTTVADRKELTLYKFGETFLSLPLTLKTTGASKYHLTEFMVIAGDSKVSYATPKEGSRLAHLVVDPLDIEFAVMKDVITTVTPEVLAIDENTNADDFGYGQFGFKVVKTISAVFSAFVKGANNFELTTAHLKIQGLRDTTSTDTTSLWVYETNLDAKANIVQMKEAAWYRIISTKQGYTSWQRTLAIKSNDKLEMLFEKKKDSVDVYVAGLDDRRVATYWKNGTPVHLSTKYSVANMIFVSQGDVYITGNEEGTSNAFYWKNGEKVILPQVGKTWGIFASGSDVHVIGTIERIVGQSIGTTAVYWKNGIIKELPNSSLSLIKARPSYITVNGSDVFISGSISYPIHSSSFYSKPVIWKNGELTTLFVPSEYYNGAEATSIKFSNGHTYVSGILSRGKVSNYIPLQAAYWKDGELVLLGSSLTKTSAAMELAVENDDVYVAGYESNVGTGWAGKYWKNGSEVPVNKEANVNLYSISVINGNVYLAGDRRLTPQQKNPSTATYWVNGEPNPCTTKHSLAFSIYVAPHN